MRLILASNNAKKLQELQTLLTSLPLVLVAQGSLGIAETEEPHRSFVENALAKARHAALHGGGPAIADDSGLCVNALDGLPGVDSAHVAPCALAVGGREQQRKAQDNANNAWLLAQMQGHANRTCHYLCLLVAVRNAHDPEPLIATGRWQGEVLTACEGEGGFGYDPLIRMHGMAHSVASMDADTKNRHSHRALAAAAMVQLMQDTWLGVSAP